MTKLYTSTGCFWLFFLFIFIISAQAGDDESFVAAANNQFTIYYFPDDSAYVRDIMRTLDKAYEEITFDFKLEKSDNFDVYLMPTRASFRDAVQGRLPDWTGAFANPDKNLMVVKSPRWSHDETFAETLVHELFHLIIHKYLGARSLPRWLDEGLAIFYSREERWKTSTALSKALVTRSVIPLEDIDYVLQYHQAKADLAYLESYAAAHYLLTTYDVEAMQLILNGLRDGKSIDDCFLAATGSTFADFETEWQDHIRRTHRWLWLSEFDQYIWTGIFALLVVAFVVRHIRNKKIEKRWQEDYREPLFMDDDEP